MVAMHQVWSENSILVNKYDSNVSLSVYDALKRISEPWFFFYKIWNTYLEWSTSAVWLM